MSDETYEKACALGAAIAAKNWRVRPWPLDGNENSWATISARRHLDAAEAIIRADTLSMKQVREWCIDESCCPQYGALTTDIAARIGISPGQTRRGLEFMRGTGAVLRHPEGDAHGQVIRWWPVGLYDKIKSEAAA